MKDAEQLRNMRLKAGNFPFSYVSACKRSFSEKKTEERISGKRKKVRKEISCRHPCFPGKSDLNYDTSERVYYLPENLV